MVIVATINADLLDAKETFICQQCNCNTIKAHGLSQYISTKYPWANPYSRRQKKTPNSTSHPDTPGTIIQLSHPSNPNKFPIFLCLMAQWLPGKPNAFTHFYPNTYIDSPKNRKQWFQDCLDILDENNLSPVAMPYGIGCGLAGGKWSDYEQLLQQCKTKITLYKL